MTVPWTLDELLPHRPPMRLIDAIEAFDPEAKTLTATVTVTPEQIFFFGTEEGVLPLLQACDWPFNFIQFRQLVRDAVMLSAGSQITTASVQNLLASIRSTPGQNAFGALNLNQTLDEINQDVIQIVLREENFNYTRTAARLGISRSSLWRKTRQ